MQKTIFKEPEPPKPSELLNQARLVHEHQLMEHYRLRALVQQEMKNKTLAGILWWNDQCRAWPGYIEASKALFNAVTNLEKALLIQEKESESVSLTPPRA